MEHTDGRRAVVPMHKGRDLPKGTLRQILQTTGLSADDLTSIDADSLPAAYFRRKSAHATLSNVCLGVPSTINLIVYPPVCVTTRCPLMAILRARCLRPVREAARHLYRDGCLLHVY